MEKKEVIVFVDFDSTLFDTPMDTPDNRELLLVYRNYKKAGWWGKGESLDNELFDISSNPWMVEKYNSHKEDGHYTILMTGRIQKIGHIVKDIVHSNNLEFDDYYFADGRKTVDFKMAKILEVVEKFQPSVVYFYDDRTEHIPSFRRLGDEIFDKHGVEFKLFHVTSGFSGYELKYGSKLR